MTVYFDNAATTQVRPEAAEAAIKAMTENYGNPSSTHTMGRAAKKILDSARKNVASALGANENEIVFTSGGTESNNLALFGAAEFMHRRGRHIITTEIEHFSVVNPIEKLSRQGWDVTYLRPDENGRVTEADFTAALRDDTVLVSVMLVNNETGARNPVEDIARVLKNSGSKALLHVDAVQGLCKVPFSVKTLGADFISVSAHKIHGPKGVGALYIKRGIRIPPLLMGGGQENELRAGTEAIPAIAGFGEAVRLGMLEMQTATASMEEVRAQVISLLAEKLPEVRVIGAGDAPHILSISLPGYKSEVLMNFLEAEGICVSKSSACKKGKRSHVLEAMRLPDAVIDGALRVSFSRYSTVEEAEYFVTKLCEARERLFVPARR